MERLLTSALSKHVVQVGFARLAWPAGQLQVVVAQRNRLHLLPLIVEHVDGHLGVDMGLC